ncbi:hypothetical protein ABZT49_04220 [Methylobacterium sp. EM32]|uniref:hypothetical protein n=1 Tax=Methylobacterium sp. EM32 TaxID=3163481 RepID=UPI0033BDD0C7
MIDIAHLLEQAGRLGAASDGADQARSTDLRRAVSAAYYAVFHAGLIAAADLVSGEAGRGTTRYCLAYRSIDHGKMKSLCQEIIKHKPSAKYQRYVPDSGWDQSIIGYCEAFVTLNEQRMLADYDPAYQVTPVEVVAYVRTARTAIDDLDAAGQSVKRAFLALLLFPPR